MSPGADLGWLEELLAKLRGVRVALFGDFALDAYWTLDPEEGEVSIETGKAVRRVRAQRYSPGGAGNVAVNLAALGVGGVRAVGLLGEDLFGRELRALLAAAGVATEDLIAGRGGWRTLVYAKPLLAGVEQERLDFGSSSALAAGDLEALAARLGEAGAQSDVVVINQQVSPGVCTPAMCARINALIARLRGTPFLVDSRQRPELFRGALLKVDERQLAALEHRGDETLFLSRGERGLAVLAAGALEEIPAPAPRGPIDPVGAGDSAVAALAAALGAGASAPAAARLAVLAAGVSVRKVHATGSATPEEILALADEVRGDG